MPLMYPICHTSGNTPMCGVLRCISHRQGTDGTGPLCQLACFVCVYLHAMPAHTSGLLCCIRGSFPQQYLQIMRTDISGSPSLRNSSYYDTQMSCHIHPGASIMYCVWLVPQQNHLLPTNVVTRSLHYRCIIVTSPILSKSQSRIVEEQGNSMSSTETPMHSFYDNKLSCCSMCHVSTAYRSCCVGCQPKCNDAGVLIDRSTYTATHRNSWHENAQPHTQTHPQCASNHYSIAVLVTQPQSIRKLFSNAALATTPRRARGRTGHVEHVGRVVALARGRINPSHRRTAPPCCVQPYVRRRTMRSPALKRETDDVGALPP